MSSVSSSTSATSSTSSTSSTTDRFSELGTEDFLALLIAELQSQDPTNPMSNEEMVNQISQIQEIRSNNALTETLESVNLGQSMATASSLVGKTIIGLPDGESEYYEGVVSYVTLEDGRLHVDDKTIKLTNVVAILSDAVVEAEKTSDAVDRTTGGATEKNDATTDTTTEATEATTTTE